jgi:hypothetical protein
MTFEAGMEEQMAQKMFRFLALPMVAAMLTLPFAFAVWAYPQTANCPQDGEIGYATGKIKTTMKPGCWSVEYKHSGTDRSDPLHPKPLKHLFWVTQCDD